MRRILTTSLVSAALLAWLGVAGCAKPESTAKTPAAEEGHDHDHAAPHGGDVIELGEEEYHAELVHGKAPSTVTIYFYDGELAKVVPLEIEHLDLNMVVDGKPQQFQLPAAPQEGDSAGKSSRFELVDAKLAELLGGDAEGRFNVKIDGKSFVGQIDHHDHDHDHEHGHEHDAK